MQDQRLCIVEQNFLRHSAEGPEGTLQPVKPTVLPLMPIRPHMQPARVAEGRNKEKDLDRYTINLDPAFAEVDLQLLARMGLEPNRRTCRGNQLTAQRCRRTLHRPQADDETLLGCQLLANHISITGMATKPFGDPVGQSVQLLRPRRQCARMPIIFCQPAPHCVARTPKLSRDPLRTPTQRRQPQHRRDLVRRLHHIPPLIVRQQRNLVICRHSNLLQ